MLTWQAPPKLLNWPLTLLLPQGEAPWAQMTATPHSRFWCSLPSASPSSHALVEEPRGSPA